MRKSPDYYRAKLREIDPSDGISKAEAVIIAQNYLLDHGLDRECDLTRSTVGESGLHENCWAVSFDATSKVKAESGLNWYALDIDKKTGQIKSSGWGPT